MSRIKSAWRREHNERINLEKMLENVEAENAKLRELVWDMYVVMWCVSEVWAKNIYADRMRELGIEVES